MDGTMLSKSLIQWVELYFLPAVYLGPNYGGCNEDNGELLQKFPYMNCNTHCPQPSSRSPPTHASTRDSWTLLGNFGSVSCGVTAPFFWVLVHTRFCLCLLCPMSESLRGKREGLQDNATGKKGKFITGSSQGPLPHAMQWCRSESPEPKLLHKFIG